MRIAADGSDLRWRPAGLGRYLDGLLRALVEIMTPDDSLAVYYNSVPAPKLFPAEIRERFIRMPRSTSYNQIGLAVALAASRPDVYLGAANIIPVLSRVPRVLIVHDCLAFRYPDSKPPRIRRYLQSWMKRSAARAERIVANSRWSASECERYLGVPSASIDVVYPGVDQRFTPGPPGDLRALGIAAPYILHVGAFEPHKGGATALDAVTELRRRGRAVRLVRTGAATGSSPDGVVDVGVVDDDTLLSLYRTAAAVCVPSVHEGFGFPVLEAMACGTPVVAARTSALPEAGGEAALYAPPGDGIAFADALERLLTDEAERNRRREAGLVRAAGFRWRDAAASIYRILHAAALRH